MQGKNEKANFSSQPFWKNIENEKVVCIPGSKHPISFVQLSGADEDLQSVPGMGQITIIISCDAEHPGAWVYGVQEDYGKMSLHGMNQILMCRFRPGAFSRYFRCDAQALTNQSIPVEELCGKKFRSVADKIAWEPIFDERCRLITDELVRTEVSQSMTWGITDYIMENIFLTLGNVRMKELQIDTGYSSRYLQKVISKNVGLSPKKICMNVRFQFILRELLKSEIALAEVAQRFGYYDQAHFTKDFQKVMNLSPGEFRYHVLNGEQ